MGLLDLSGALAHVKRCPSCLGSLAVWNSDAATELQVCAGDRIDAINGEGGDEAIILRQLERVRGKALKLTITKAGNPLTLGVSKPMGLHVLTHKTHPYLHVQPEEAGFMEKWKGVHPCEQLNVGDRIFSVNDVCGGPETLLRMMKECQEMDLTFLRYQEFDASKLSPTRSKQKIRRKSSWEVGFPIAFRRYHVRCQQAHPKTN